MNRIFQIAAAVFLLSLSLFFAFIVGLLGVSEVLPAIRQGTLNVETSIMILNRVWVGNEIYILLAAYLLLATGFAWGALRLLRKARSG